MEYRSCKCLLLDHVLKEKDAIKTQLKEVEDKKEKLRLEKEEKERQLEKQIEVLKKESEDVKAAKDKAQIAKYERDCALHNSEGDKFLQENKLFEYHEDIKKRYREIEFEKTNKENDVEIAKYKSQEAFYRQTLDEQITYFDGLREKVEYPSSGKYLFSSAILLFAELVIVFIFWLYIPKDCSDNCISKQISIYILYTMVVSLFIGIGFLSVKLLYDYSKQYSEDKERYNEWQRMINNKIIKLIP